MRIGFRLLWAVAAAVAMIASPAAAQDNPTLAAFERGIDDGNQPDAAPRARILEFTGTVQVVGPTADVTLEFLLGTDGPGTDEIRLDLALPRGSVVTGYSLDVGGTLIPGVLLEQPRARNVYEDEVREGIDPGLAEITTEDRFATRVFPVTPAMPRRIRVRFSAPFDPATGVILPLRTARAIGSGRFSVTATGLAAAPEVRFDGQAIALAGRGGDWSGEVVLSGRALDGGLVIAPVQPENALLHAEHASGESFFLIADTTETAPAPARQGGRLRVYWDRSLSHGRDRIDRETEMLAALVELTAPEAIDLVTFASDAPRVETLPDAAALRSALAGVTYRGGTSLEGLDALALPEAQRCVMLFDGRVTIDHTAEFDPACALALVSTSSSPDSARLGRLGSFVPLAEGAERAVAEALAQPMLRVISARDQRGRRLSFRSLPAGDGGWLIAGRLDDSSEVFLRIALPDGRTVQRGYLVPDAEIAADAPGALWAAAEISALQDDPRRHDDLLSFARRYNVAGTRLAFLVLESPEQYISADVDPPAGFQRDWQKEYRWQKDAHDSGLARARTERFDFVLREWEERRAWWARTYTPTKRVRRDADDDEDDEILEQNVALAPPPPPPPPPVPVDGTLNRLPGVEVTSDVAGFGDSDEANIIVTGLRRSRSGYDSPSPITVVDGGRAREVAVEMEDLLGDQPYLAALEAAAQRERLAVLAEQQRAYGTLPGFFLDTAEWFRLKGDLATSRLLLLSALELPEANDETRQVAAFRLERDGELDRAIELAELVAAGSQFRPQPKRALALALAARGRGKSALGRRDLERAFKLLTEVALDPTTGDFEGIEVVALMEANALLAALEAVGGMWELDPRLVGLLDTDLRVVVEWTGDDADIDLWVDEPNGERVIYSDPLSSAGGHLSNDMTDGYGPEEYAIRRAPRGTYRVRVNGFDADRINPNGAGRVLVRLVRNFGRPDERLELVDAGLDFQRGGNRDDDGGALPIATVEVAGRPSRRQMFVVCSRAIRNKGDERCGQVDVTAGTCATRSKASRSITRSVIATIAARPPARRWWRGTQ